MTPEERARQALDQDGEGQICLLSVATLASVIRAAVAEEREACAKVADRFAREAAERGPMIGGAPMHGREIHDRQLGELVANNIAAAIRAEK